MITYSKKLRDIVSFLGLSSESFSTLELDTDIFGITVESSKVKPGYLFAALPGARTHGAHFVADAIDRGAVAILTDGEGVNLIKSALAVVSIDQVRECIGTLSSYFYDNPSASLKVVAVTGTNGKTTVTSILEYLWNRTGVSAGIIGTLGARYLDGVESVFIPSTRTTPEACELQAELALMRDSGVRAVAMEVSSHALSLHRVDGIHFALSLFTNLTQDHLDFHHSMEEYFEAKSTLFNSRFTDKALINIDDPYGNRLFSQSSIPAISIANAESAHLGEWKISSDSFEIIDTEGRSFPIDSPLVGDFNRMNVAMALLAFVETGGDLIQGIALIREFPGVPGRLEQVGPGRPLILVDYAHTPDAVTRVLASLRPHTQGRIIAVLGCGGDRDPSKRPEMGRALQTGADLAIATSDNPRSEDPEAILYAMCGVGFQGVRIIDRREAIAFAIDEANDEDVVLIAGKGHEQGQESKGVVTPFDDREVALEILATRGRS